MSHGWGKEMSLPKSVPNIEADATDLNDFL